MTGLKYYAFKFGVQNRVKIFREKTQENLEMKTRIPCNLFPLFQINVLGTSSDVPIMNVLDVLIYVMVTTTVGTIQMKTIVEVK